MTRWQQFVDDWKDCRACPLWRTRQHVVLAKGQVPCDLLFVGEAPGHSENVVGKPFIGPAGKLLDAIIADALEMVPYNPDQGPRSFPRLAFTNLICCIPLDEETGAKTETPPVEAIMACQERLRQFVEIAAPKLIVCVGSIAEDWLDSKMLGGLKIDVPKVSIVHPAAILRLKNPALEGSTIRQTVFKLRQAVKKVVLDG